MSKALNRSRTTGAFGNSKPRLLGAPSSFRNLPKNVTVEPPKAGEDRVSDMLLQFAKPILEQAGNNHTAARGAMNVAVLIWNGLVDGENALGAAREKLLTLPGASAEQVDELISNMKERKAEICPEARHMVMDFQVDFNKNGGLQLRVASANLAPKGVEKVAIN